MLIAGVQKLTTLDYPGRLAAVVFTAGCNFRCGYCHNPHLVEPEQVKKQARDLIPERVFFNFLKTRKGLIDGVCVTGGEPALQPDLVEFALKIKNMGFKLKIDTNGTRPAVVENLISQKVVDYLAMDIKTSLAKYRDIVGADFAVEEIKKSKEIIQNSGLKYEFRTTAVREKHDLETFKEIGRWLTGAEKYYIQNFRSKIVLKGEYKNYGGFSEGELAEIKTLMEKYVKFCGLRA